VAEAPAPVAAGRLWAEFVALYVGAPVAIALFMPPALLFEALALFALAGLVLMWRTGGYDWRGLVRGWRRLPWGAILAIAVIVAALGVAILWWTHPGAILNMARTRPGLMLAVWLLYPFLSALPQELIFRALFFHRYAGILPPGRGAIVLNAALFSLAHLMYWSGIVLVLTFLGGVCFARAYLRRGFPSAWVLHAVAGNVLFTVGMGVYFYSGNVVRPFQIA
jgi:membrane protease YdiL (CAAX protease family)